MKRDIFKKSVWYLVVVLSVFTLLNANEREGYKSVSYALMQDICKERPQVTQGGNPTCPCSEVNFAHFNTSETFSFGKLIYGNFTNTHTEEIFVPTSGCEAHAYSWGGSILFRKNAGRWHRVFYRAGNPGECKKLSLPNGRDELLCLGTFMAQGYMTDTLVHYEVRGNDLRIIETLYGGESDEGAFDSKQKNTLVKSWRLNDIDQDGYNDVVLTVNQSARGFKKITYLYRDGVFVQNTQHNTAHSENISKEKTFYMNENGIEITLHYPASIRAGQPFLLKAMMRNRKANARMGGLTLSFPDFKTMRTKTVHKTFDSLKAYDSPAKLYSSIRRSTIVSRYFMLEGWENRWQYDKSKSFAVKLTAPEGLKRLRINIRAVLLIDKNKRSRREIISPSHSGSIDQQGYYVKEITIPVKG